MRRVGGALAALASVLAVSGAAAPARAQSILDEAPTGRAVRPSRYRSPQHFAFEIKFGTYRPNVDSEFSRGGVEVRTPYADYFGGGNHLYSQIELDWQIFHGFGSLAVGGGLGYFSVSGPAPLGTNTGQLSGDTSNFRVVPLSLSAVYRFDRLLDDRNIPVVPYGKIGLDYALWRITNGNGDTAQDAMGNSGEGGTLGWHAAVGVALVIDWLDPEAARDFDTDLGVNHTALTFDYTYADISGLGQPGRLHVGDTTWAIGLLLEF